MSEKMKDPEDRVLETHRLYNKNFRRRKTNETENKVLSSKDLSVKLEKIEGITGLMNEEET